MRRLAILFLFLFLACRTVSLALKVAPTNSVTLIPSKIPSVAPSPTATSTPFSTPTTLPITATSNIPSSRSFSVRFHPDGLLYVGDLVSLEVIPPADMNVEGRQVQVAFDDLPVEKSAEARFESFGIGGRKQATFQWIWDTTGLVVGDHTLTFSIQPQGFVWRESVSLSPRGQVPPPEPSSGWASAESDCCLVYYFKGTPAERDLVQLLEKLDQQAEEIPQQLEVGPIGTGDLDQPLTVTFLPRVLGHGGFASSGISVSYLDRNYTGGDLGTILHHELVHIFDSRLGGELRPTILMEGLAVHLSGGHFKPEPLTRRAAALLAPVKGCVPYTPAETSSGSGVSPNQQAVGCGLDRFIHLDDLVDDFYLEQHEIGYLEAGALVGFMVKTWGWKAYSDFYRDIRNQPQAAEDSPQTSDQYRAINAALVSHFGITLDQLDQRFLYSLSQEKFTPAESEDVRLVVMFYDAVRRYQQVLDPSAYFLTAWLPDAEQMRQRGIVADYLRRPSKIENLVLENMLVAANSHLLSGRYELAFQTIDAANAVLDVYPHAGDRAFIADPLASDYLALVKAVREIGFTPERIQIEGETARIWASKSGSVLSELNYGRNQDSWILEGTIQTQTGNIDLFGFFPLWAVPQPAK